MKLLFIFLILFFSACTDKIQATQEEVIITTNSMPILMEGTTVYGIQPELVRIESIYIYICKIYLYKTKNPSFY